MLSHELHHRFRRPFADLAAIDIHAAHARLRRERNKVGFVLRHFAAANVVALLGQNHDRPALGGFVGEARKLRRVGHLGLRHPVERNKFDGLPVAQRDGAGLVQ